MRAGYLLGTPIVSYPLFISGELHYGVPLVGPLKYQNVERLGMEASFFFFVCRGRGVATDSPVIRSEDGGGEGTPC